MTDLCEHEDDPRCCPVAACNPVGTADPFGEAEWTIEHTTLAKHGDTRCPASACDDLIEKGDAIALVTDGADRWWMHTRCAKITAGEMP